MPRIAHIRSGSLVIIYIHVQPDPPNVIFLDRHHHRHISPKVIVQLVPLS